MIQSQNIGLDLEICSKDFEVALATKYLGVQTDSFLDCKTQIKAVFIKVSRAVGLLKYALELLAS